MYDLEARHIIEALRSGVPSRTVGQCFAQARPALLERIQTQLNEVREQHVSSGMVIRGRYGEGKTHLLNTVLSMAYENNMVVSLLPLSLENPMDKMHTMYPALVSQTYLPGREQPGFFELFSNLSLNSDPSNQLQVFALKELESDKLFYTLRTYLSAQNNDDFQFSLRSDFEGNFVSNADVKKMYRAEFKQTAKFNTPFAKTLHTFDYIAFLSKVFQVMGYAGWVILFDEAELMGRLGKKARINFYRNMAKFINPPPSLINTFTMFAFTDSYVDEVIDAKHDIRNLNELFPDNQEPMLSMIHEISNANRLRSLTQDEIRQVVCHIREYHARAYSWTPASTDDELMHVADSASHALRTRLRSVIEYLDQEFQYGNAMEASIGALQTSSYEEATPSLEAMNTDEDPANS